jgi:GntR family histidine utilization transcriptional repressor
MPRGNVIAVSATRAPLARGGARPLYQQIKDSIRAEIRAGVRSPGERMASENELVHELGVSRMTVNRAFRELAQEGYLQRVHGVGTFVAERMRHASLIELKNIADEVREQGKTHRCEVLELCAKPADDKVAARMNLVPGEQVFHVRLVHYSDHTPIQLEERYVNPTFAPGFLDVNFTEVTPTEYLTGLFRPAEMEHIVQAVMPDQVTRRLLQIGAGEPCLKLKRRTWKDGDIVTAVTLHYPGSRYDLAARYATDNYRKRG